MRDLIHEDPKIMDPKNFASAERKMLDWAWRSEHRTLNGPAADRSTQRAIRFVTISREIGARGSEIGRQVAQRLGWTVYDKNLLDRMAQCFHVSRMMLDLVDETRRNWVYDVLGTWMDQKIVPHEKFVACLARVMRLLAREGQAVIVGRGAQFLLPRNEIVAVRIIAPLKYRIQQIMSEMGVNESDARRRIEEVDRGRRELVEQYFHRDITDPHLYDLVVNVERCGVAAAVEAIVGAAK